MIYFFISSFLIIFLNLYNSGHSHLISFNGLPAQFFKFYLPPKNQSISSQITHS